jgi:hypothetical protein
MDAITQAILTARAAYSAARQHADETADALSLVEADLFLNCGYPALGKNETERKAVFDNLKRSDRAWALAKRAADNAQRAKTAAADALANAEDVRRGYENELRRQWLQCQFGVNIDPAEFYSDNQF